MDDVRRIASILMRLGDLELKMNRLEDRVGVLEECTCSHESRLEDIEDWQEKTDDKLDAS